MLKRYRSAAVGMAALLVTGSLALAAGSYSTLPIVGGASFCASTVSGTGSLGGITGQGQGSTGSICAQTVPAGPSVVTGNELIPADTVLSGGASPQSVTLSLASLNALPTNYALFASTSATNTLPVTNLVGNVVILGNAALSATTVQFPSAPIDGQQLGLSANFTIASLTMSPNTGQTIDTQAKVTAITASTTIAYGYRFVWRAANTTWYRLQ